MYQVKSILSLVLISVMFCHVSCVSTTEKIPEEESVVTPAVFDIWGDTVQFASLTPEDSSRLLQPIEETKSALEQDSSEMNFIWYGRRLAYFGQYLKAIGVYTQGLEVFPESYTLLRHRGHRWVSIREYDKAIADFQKAAELAEGEPLQIEPDGIPNALNQPLSNTHFNIYYHLGLAYYLMGQYEHAEEAYLNCLKYCDNNDLNVATWDWLYMTWKRTGNENGADSLLMQVSDTMEIIENDVYHKRLLMYKGDLMAEDFVLDPSSDDYSLTLATQGYGIANHYLTSGDTVKAVDLMKELLKTNSKTAFGYLAAEADLKNLGQGKD